VWILRPQIRTSFGHAALLTNKPLAPAQLPAGIDPETIPPELRPPTRISMQARAVFSPDYRADGKPAQRLLSGQNEIVCRQ